MVSAVLAGLPFVSTGVPQILRLFISMSALAMFTQPLTCFALTQCMDSGMPISP